MEYKKIIQGEFVSRPNRFIAFVKICDHVETVHVKNTGRCKELLIPGATVFLSVSDNPNRKTKYDLIGVIKESGAASIMINMDSQIPNDVASEWIVHSGLFSADAVVKREVRFGTSRFDLFVQDGDRKAFIEVKGVTLEKNGVALFPDAPTERGVKHVLELIRAKEQGFEAYVLFVIQMDGVRTFQPNEKMHSDFANALRSAREKCVEILAMDCKVTPNSSCIKSPVPVCWD